ncbi:MAG: TonB-dependent receptor [Pseudomonadota bacterium]|nr:TonB-dependent receptor [Pseudomonadota bacterium]
MHFRKQILRASSATIFVLAAVPAMAQTAPASSSEDDSEVVVTGIRRSLQDSIDTKRRAGSIVEVISAEAVGKLPDTNIAESLARLPGVTVDHQFGEGEQLSIAGVEPALNRLTIDGHSVASADWGGNPSDRSSRSFNYSLLSPTIISQAIVYKTPEARMQEGAIGATVDVVTRKPLDLKPNTIAATGGYEYNDRANRGSFRGSALYSWHNADETFGILASVNYDKEQLSRAGIASYYYDNGSILTGGYPKDANGNIVYNGPNGTVTSGATINGSLPNAATIAAFGKARYAAILAREFFRQERKRIGFNGAIDFKPTDNLRLTATALVIRGNYDNVSSSEYTYGFQGQYLTAATLLAPSAGNTGIISSATFGPIPASAVAASGQLDTNYRRTRIKNDSYSLLFDWTPGDWSVTGNVGYTRASGGKDPEYLLDFRTKQGFTAGAIGRDTNVNWASPGADATKWLSNFSAYGGETVTDNSGKAFVGRQIGGIPTQSGFTLDKEVYGEINVKRDVSWGPVTTILFGGRYVDHENSNTTFSNAIYTNQNFTLADLNPYIIANGFYDGLGASGNASPYATLDRDGIVAALSKYGNFTVDRGLAQSEYWLVKERIAAGYVQANFELGKFRGNIGGRFVSTRDQSNFYIANNGPFVLTRVTNTENRFLPAANLSYQAGEDVVLRLAAAKVIARPRFGDLAGSLSVNDIGDDPNKPGQRIGNGNSGNPDLKPYSATNLGATAEWYFAKGSLLSAEFFYRDISNYIGSDVQNGVVLINANTGKVGTYSITRPINGGKASVTGVSVSGNANLMWGFGIQANYTFASADTGFATGLPFLSRNTVTIQPYYENGPFQARVSYNRRSKYFYRIGRLQSQDYTDAYRQVDAQISYTVKQGFSLTASASNLLDETYYQYSSSPEFPTSIYKNGRVFSLSASFKL